MSEEGIAVTTGLGRSGRRWRAGFFALLALCVMIVVLATYALLDQGISYSYLRDDLDYIESDFAILRRLAPALRQGDSRADVLVLLRRQNPQALISSTDSTVTVGGLVFRFGPDGRLSVVERPSG